MTFKSMLLSPNLFSQTMRTIAFLLFLLIWWNGGQWDSEGVAVLFYFSVMLYFLPSFTAYRRKKTNALSLFIINLFFGWTLIARAICLSWAYSTSQVDPSESKKGDISST